MNKKGETFGCLVGMFGAAVFVIGLLVCIFSRFFCIELDFTEEQRNDCETKANFIILFGIFVTLGATVVMIFSAKILGFFANKTGKTGYKVTPTMKLKRNI